MNPNVVIEFLREHPNFLEENAHLLLDPLDGQDSSVFSLTERQNQKLRERNAQLEAQIRKLVRLGGENDQISEKLHRVVLAFFVADSLAATLEILKKTLKEDFQVPTVVIRLWAAKNKEAISMMPVSREVREYADKLDAPYCGRETSQEIRGWFQEEKEKVGSFALIPLRTAQTFGILALASPDEARFHAGMGTFFLTRLSELASVALARYLPVEKMESALAGTER
jgi:uncharacterized protein YigA (DUF484 family)